ARGGARWGGARVGDGRRPRKGVRGAWGRRRGADGAGGGDEPPFRREQLSAGLDLLGSEDGAGLMELAPLRHRVISARAARASLPRLRGRDGEGVRKASAWEVAPPPLAPHPAGRPPPHTRGGERGHPTPRPHP